MAAHRTCSSASKTVRCRRAHRCCLADSTYSSRWPPARPRIDGTPRISSRSRSRRGNEKSLIKGGADARYLPTGHLVYAVGGSVVAVAFDVQRLEATGSPVPMVAGVSATFGGQLAQQTSASPGNGTLVYIPGTTSLSAGQMAVALTDRRRVLRIAEAPARSVRGTTRRLLTARASRSGPMTAKRRSSTSMTCPARPGMQRLTFGGNNRFPIWISNNRVAFQSDREGDLAIFWQSAVGGAAERLTKPEPGTSHVPESWSPKGDRFLFSVKKGSDVSLWTYSLRDRKATPFGEVHSPTPTNAVFSPDGRWVAYASTERTSADDLRPAVPGLRSPVSAPLRSLRARHAAALVSGRKGTVLQPGPGRFAWVSVTTRPTLTFGNPEAVPRPFQTGPRTERRMFDITPGGKFVGLIQAGQTESGAPIAPQLQVVLNWFEELKRLVPATK